MSKVLNITKPFGGIVSQTLKYNTQRNVALEERLGNIVNDAINGKIDCNELYERSEGLKYEFLEQDPAGYDAPLAHILLKESLGDLHLLHDPDTGLPLESLRNSLLGNRSCVFVRECENKTFEITYHPYRDPKYRANPVSIKEL
jgi:hypothetical protein